jgi:hypothetical protein
VLCKIVSVKGKRLIVLHAGTRSEGLIDVCDLVFLTKSNDGDHHQEIGLLVNPCFIHVHDIRPCFPKRFDLSQIITPIIDNHQEMISVVFLEWFENQLMPALKNLTLVLLDNASYHNVKTEDTMCPNISQKNLFSLGFLFVLFFHIILFWYQ